jgi:S1-C subfamily serine protease
MMDRDRLQLNWLQPRRRHSFRWLLCLGFLFLGLSPNSARAKVQLEIDKVFGKVSGWTIGFSQDIGGCLAAAAYRDGTTVWLGFSGGRDTAYIAFTSPKWKAIEVDGGYDLQLVMRRHVWNGKFYGLERKDEKGVYTNNVKSAFLDDLAASGGFRLYLDRKLVSSFSLEGSRDALDRVIACQKEYIAAASNGAESDRKDQQKGGSSGTGFFVNSTGNIVTNHHVIASCSTIRVVPVGGQETSAYVVAKDKTNDLAILKTSISPIAVPSLREQPRLGESVYVFGFPLTGLLSASGNFTSGTITALFGLGDDSRFLQISAPVQPGNSGGPVIDKFGNVVGVVVSKLNALGVAAATDDIPQNVNFAIKSTIAANFLDASGISPSDTPQTRELSPEAIADQAKLYTVRVLCN